jgi:PEP-CTERM motif
MKFTKSTLTLAALLAAAPAFAHISYKGNFGTLDGVGDTGLSVLAKTVTSNAGWADGTDTAVGDTLLWADSHKSAAYIFVLTAQSSVTFTAMANANVAGAVGGLLPGFSIYEGSAAVRTGGVFPGSQTSADYDTSAASLAYRATLPGGSGAYSGLWNAKGDWKIGGDGDVPGDFSQLSSFSYKGSAFATSGNSATGTFILGPGTYSVFVGGNDFTNYGSAQKFGLDAMLSVTAVPEPETYALLLAGLGVVGAVARRRQAKAGAQ